MDGWMDGWNLIGLTVKSRKDENIKMTPELKSNLKPRMHTAAWAPQSLYGRTNVQEASKRPA